MSRPVAVFWGAAVAATGGFAILTALLLPFDALGLDTAVERERAWLLTLWTGGVLGILFGISTILGSVGGFGVRDVIEAGSLRKAVDRHRAARARSDAVRFHRSFGWWLVSAGALLIAIYFTAWIALGGVGA